MSLILSGSDGVSDIDGTVSTPAIRGTDSNTGIFFPAADTIAFAEGGTESMRITSTGTVAIGTTTTPTAKLWVESGRVGLSNTYKLGWHSNPAHGDLNNYITGDDSTNYVAIGTGASERMRIDSSGRVGIGTSSPLREMVLYRSSGEVHFKIANGTTGESATDGFDLAIDSSGIAYLINRENQPMVFLTNGTERMRIDSSGNLLLAKTSLNSGLAGVQIEAAGAVVATRTSELCFIANRLTDDGPLFSFRQASTEEGSISVSGSTVSYNGGHLSRWSQLPDGSKDDTILKGTVLTNLDDMCVWEKDGVVADNEQLNKMKVSDVEGDTNVAGVFVNWTIDADYGVDDMNVAMTGDMIIRIAEGVVVQKGDLLMSAGDGTAKPQGDDIVRSKTIAKVTSNHVTCTYADGSYCVPCVLMAC